MSFEISDAMNFLTAYLHNEDKKLENLKNARDSYNQMVKSFEIAKIQLEQLKGTVLHHDDKYHKITDVILNLNIHNKNGGIATFKLVACNEYGKSSIWQKVFHSNCYLPIASFFNACKILQ